ncbi:hypothetical protein CLV93_101576 [Prolixibacter denitrificans]|uniref:Uncharacterized protein n=1 Tax=Prolixibacter denitrificans TaxID=1541063 RepID=A0A2P8CKX6_9BACT|nr:hypothetical protein CLV93_101576 [Prolixibacter denitrificans]GET20232.1 hypothetical protein JCM18694_04780 [Prolixibacter denitrificans]
MENRTRVNPETVWPPDGIRDSRLGKEIAHSPLKGAMRYLPDFHVGGQANFFTEGSNDEGVDYNE